MTSSTDESAGPLPTGALLPLDSEIPTTLIEREAHYRESHPWQEEYVSPLVTLSSDDDRWAWFHFCTGHHVEFLYWEATRVACRRVVEDLAAGADPAHWMGRVARLIEGSGAMLIFCGDMKAAVYDPCLRVSMEAQRDDFSGDMSRDFLTMMGAKADMVEALEAASEGDHLRAFRQAERFWARHHGTVIDALHPGRSLLREKRLELEALSDGFDFREYVDTVVRGEQALADYDEYFGVQRSDSMPIGDYWTQAVEKLATVHRSFRMTAELRTALMRGDGVLLAVISERLGDVAR